MSDVIKQFNVSSKEELFNVINSIIEDIENNIKNQNNTGSDNDVDKKYFDEDIDNPIVKLLVHWTNIIAKNNEINLEKVATTISTLLDINPWCVVELILAEKAKESKPITKQAVYADALGNITICTNKNLISESISPALFSTEKEISEALKEVIPFIKAVQNEYKRK